MTTARWVDKLYVRSVLSGNVANSRRNYVRDIPAIGSLNLMYISICHEFHYVKDAANTRLQITHHAQITRIRSDLVQ